MATRKFLYLATSAVAAAASLAAPLASASAATDTVEHGYIVQLKTTANIQSEAAQAEGRGGEVTDKFSKALRGFAVDASGSEIARIKTDPQVAAVYPDYPVSIDASQVSPPVNIDSMDSTNPLLPNNGSYTYTADGRGVDVYVVDTGVNYNHFDLVGRTTTGFNAIADGRVDGLDCNGHGSHVAGIAAGSRYGVAKAARVVPVRVLGCTGSGSTSDIIRGIDWVIAQRAASGRPAVMNLSLGMVGSNAPMEAAVANAYNNRVIPVVAAGNSGIDACGSSPARSPLAITVGSVNRLQTQSSFSNFGSCLDVYAPGESIQSAWHTANNVVATLNGTSMAAPHVAGVAAMYLSAYPQDSAASITSRVLSGSTSPGVLNRSAGSPDLFAKAPNIGFPVAAVPVVNTVAPSISGNFISGGTATVNFGTWTGAAQYQATLQVATSASGPWFTMSTIQGGSEGAPVNFTVSPAHLTGAMRVIVTASNSAFSTSATSANVVTTGFESVTGGRNPAATGDVLTAPAYMYFQWQRLSNGSWVDIAGATNRTYTVSTADGDGEVRVNLGSEVINPDTSQIGRVWNASMPRSTATPTPVLVSPPTIIGGGFTNGETVTADFGTWTGANLYTLNLKYSASPQGPWATFESFTSSTGAPVSVRLTPSQMNGYVRSEVAASFGNATSTAVSESASTIGTESVTGGMVPVRTGNVLYAPATYTYFQWQRLSNGSWVDIAGATTMKYVVTAADGGGQVRAMLGANVSDPSGIVRIWNPSISRATGISTPTLASAPAVISTPTYGTYTVRPATWSSSTPVEITDYQWQRYKNGYWTVVGSGETYAASTADAGSRLRVRMNLSCAGWVGSITTVTVTVPTTFTAPAPTPTP